MKYSHKEEYNLFFNNCETFAYDCTTGERDSYQVLNAGAGFVGGAGVGAGVVGTAAATPVSVGGILGFFGVTTTVVASAPVAVVGGAFAAAAAAGLAIYKGLKVLDNAEDKDLYN